MLYAFFTLCALILVWRIRPKAVTNLHQVDDAPLHHVAMPDSMSSSPLVAALDPRVDEQVGRIRCKRALSPKSSRRSQRSRHRSRSQVPRRLPNSRTPTSIPTA